MEDETAIEQRIEYDEKTDQVYRYCGKREEGHKCEDNYTFKVCVGNLWFNFSEKTDKKFMY